MTPRTSDDPGAFGRLGSEQVHLLERAAFAVAQMVLKRRSEANWSVSFLLEIHRELFEDVFPDRAGVLRLEDVSLGSLPIARPAQILHRLADLVTMARDAIEASRAHSESEQKAADIMRRVAVFHAASVTTQPFIDGNKRWARLVLNAVLVDCGYHPGTWIDDTHPERYLAAIDETVRGEPDPLGELILSGWIRQRSIYRAARGS